ncbi:MAG: zinc-finger domain-containing protein [Mariprofundus sp.]|nr:zinc-finger domain-containing protein [Mariprofundus sp.]
MDDIIRTTEETVSCSGNGQHPLVYINLKNDNGRCQYCGQRFAKVEVANQSEKESTPA